MNATDIFNYIAGLEAQCAMLSEQSKFKKENLVDVTKFYAVPMTTAEVAKLHGVSISRVRDYASRGLIELHPNSTDARMLFRASTILAFDFSELRKAKLRLKW